MMIMIMMVMIVAMVMAMVMVSVIMVVIMMMMRLPGNKTVQAILDHDCPDHNDENARCHTEPGIELLR